MRYLGQRTNPLDLAVQADVPKKRRGPLALNMERTNPIWTINFDNGCGLQFPSNPRSPGVYGVNQPMDFTQPVPQKNVKAFLLQNILGILPYITRYKGYSGVWVHWKDDCVVLDPVNDREAYDFSEAYLNPEDTDPISKENQRNAIRVMWELGIWTDEELSFFGAKKR